jgi:hypothetical protein
MESCTIGAICLGPTGNEQGGHYFMSLATSRWLTRNRWTELPMPHDSITRVGNLGRQQGMPKTITFADRFSHEIPDGEDDVDDDHDSDYNPDDSSTHSSTLSDDSLIVASSSDEDLDSDNDDDDDDDDRPKQHTRGLLTASSGDGSRR